MELEELLKPIKGKREEKESLLKVRSDYELYKGQENEITGFMITGDARSGKTLLLNAFLDSFDCKKVTIKPKNLSAESIHNLFESIKDDKEVIVYFDEINNKYLKYFKKEMLHSNGNVFFVATRTFAIYDEKIDPLIFVPGFFNREIRLNNIDWEMVVEVVEEFFYKHHLRYYRADIFNIINRYQACGYEDLVKSLEIAYSVEGQDLKASDLRPHKYNHLYQVIPNPTYLGEVSYRSCVNAAGHILLAYQHLHNTQFTSCYFTSPSDYTCGIYHYEYVVPEKIKKRFDYPYLLETKIKIAMAGYLNEVVNFKSFDGAKAINDKRIINESLDEIVATCYMNPKYNNEKKNIKYEKVDYQITQSSTVNKLKEKLFKKYEKQTKLWIKENRNGLKAIADLLQRKKYIDFKDVNYAFDGVIKILDE